MVLRWGAKIYLWAVGLAGAIILLLYLPLSLSFLAQNALTLGIFTLIAFFAEVYEIRIIHTRAVSTGTALYLAVILLGGLPLALSVTLLGMVSSEIFLRWEYIASKSFARFARSVSFNTCQATITTFLAGMAFTWGGGHPLLGTPDGSLNSGTLGYQSIIDYLPAIITFLVYSFVNTSLVAGIITLTQGVRYLYQLEFSLRYLHIQLLSLGVLGNLIAVVYAQNPWNLILLLIPLVLVHISLRNYTKLRVEAKKTFEQMTQALGERDPYTFRHSKDVAHLSVEIAREMNLPQDKVEVIESAALIHDIGKIAIPDEILHKPGPLTEEERKIVERHPMVGAELIKDLEIYGDGVDIVRHEHEYWDGQGYPDGLAGGKIPIGARIVAVADMYNALTTDRPYRKAYTPAEAFEVIRKLSGTQLDPKIVAAFFSIIDKQRRLN